MDNDNNCAQRLLTAVLEVADSAGILRASVVKSDKLPDNAGSRTFIRQPWFDAS